MYESIEQEYLAWLYSRIGNVDTAHDIRSHYELFTQLLNTEFIWLIANDDNRVEDGKYLRDIFLEELRISDDDVDQRWLLRGCSVLEMLLGLATRLEFLAESTASHWVWEMLDNLGLTIFDDRHYDAEAVDSIVQRFIFRDYGPDGRGGVFPLRHPQKDQSKTELWYQLQEYIQER